MSERKIANHDVLTNFKYCCFIKGIHAVRIDFFYIKSGQYSMFYTNCN